MTLPPTRFDYDAPVPADADLGVVHFVAIGGAGMSGVARIMLDHGVGVQGSDLASSGVLDDLAARGARIHEGHDAAYLDGADTVVVSSAIRETNVELATARARGLRVLHRAQGLAATMQGAAARVAVAGANGKTTTTAMLVATLVECGEDPSFAVGGELVGLDTNARAGAGRAFVVEADESDGSFLVYRPHIALVTSVQADHLDHYGSAAVVEEAYRAFVDTIEPGGLLVACVDDPGAAALARWARESRRIRVLGYGTDPRADVTLVDVVLDGRSSTARIEVNGQSATMQLPVPGDYNLRNAAAVVAATVCGLGLPLDQVCRALAGFRGVRRRFEFRGEVGGVSLVDDYAHNPAKVAAVVSSGARFVAGRGRLIAVFQPHLYSRTRDFATEFAAALAPADVVLVLDVYAAREDPMPGVGSHLVVDELRTRWTADAVGDGWTDGVGEGAGDGVGDRHLVNDDLASAGGVDLTDLSVAADLVVSLARPGDLVLTIGAGDVTTIAPRVLAGLRARGDS